EMQSLTRKLFESKLDLELEIEALDAHSVEDGIELSWKSAEGEARRERFEYVLAATGRRPNLERLGLGAAKLPLDEDGHPNFDHRTMQIGDTPIFLAGDFSLERALLHEAADEGRIAGTNAAN